MTTQGRSAAIDVVRVLGVLAVAAGHMWASPPGDPNLVRVAIYSWQVPIFFFLTGYLWSFGRPLGREVVTRARSLLLPYAVWTLIFGIPIVAIATVAGVFPAREIALTLWGGGLVRGPFAPYWFLPIMFFVAVALRASERAPRWVAWTLAIGGLAACYFVGADLSRLPQDVFFTLPCMLFALVGQEVRHVEDLLSARLWIGLGLLVVSAVLLFTRAAAPLDMKLGDFGTPVLSVAVSLAVCSGLVFVAKAALDRWQGAGPRFVTELATVSVVVLLTHTFLFDAYRALSLPSPVVYAAAVVTAWAGGVLIHRTILSTPLAGVPRAKPRERVTP